MTFQKLNKNSIRCVFTQEELDERGVAIEDLMEDHGKAQSFLQEVLEEAGKKLGFHVNGAVLNIQMTTSEDGNYVLTISDDTNTAVKNLLNELKDKLTEITENAAAKGQEDQEENVDPTLWIPEELKAGRQRTKGGKTVEKAGSGTPGDEKNPTGRLAAYADDQKTLSIWGQFSSLSECIRFAEAAPELSKVPSRLFKYDGTYFLEITLTMRRREMAGIAFKVTEFADGMYANMPGVMEIIEHGTLLLKGNALEGLLELK